MGNKRKYGGVGGDKANKKRHITPLDVGMKGLLFVHEPMKESVALRESFKVMEEYLDMYNNSNDSDDVKSKSPISKGTTKEKLEAEMEALKEEGKQKIGKLQRINLNSRGTFMISFADQTIDVVDFVNFMFADFAKNKIQKLRFVSRIIPIENVCRAKVEELNTCVKPLIEREFGGIEEKVEDAKRDKESKDSLKYCIFIKRRCNKLFARETITETVYPLLPSYHKVDFKDPEKVIIVQVIAAFILLSITSTFKEYFEYNVSKVCGVKEEECKDDEEGLIVKEVGKKEDV